MGTLTDKSKKPTDAMLTRVLGRTRRHWDLLVDHLRTCEGIAVCWKCYSGKYGWTLKATKKRKAVLYMTPEDGHFMASMALRDDAVQGLRARGLPAEFVAEVCAAKAYPEGRPARIDVTSLAKVSWVRKLIAAKLDG